MYYAYRSLLIRSAAFALLLFALVALDRIPPREYAATPAHSLATASEAIGSFATSSPVSAPAPASQDSASSPATTSAQEMGPVVSAEVGPSKASDASGIIERMQNLYPFAAQEFSAINIVARDALVNILCMPRTGGMRPISASGIVVDPRGVILTNAHVAQYLLLASDPRVDLSCTIRTGSPAKSRFEAEVLYLPPVWVQEHAREIQTARAAGTGEHDYALLRITRTIDGAPMPALRSLPLDTRFGIAFPDDEILAASYPAEFLGGLATQQGLYPVSSIATVRALLTFGRGTPDLLSLGGIIQAQSGASGGAIVNAWGRLVGVIVTTSDGKTTGERDLRALSLAYINTDIEAQTTHSLAEILSGDPAREAEDFNTQMARELVDLYMPYLSDPR